MSLARVTLATLLSATVSSSVIAQDSTSRPVARHEPSEFELRSSGSVAFIQSRPTGEFRSNIGFGYGALGSYVLRVDRLGVLGLRADVGILDYGSEHFDAPLSSTVGGRVRVRVNTNNYIVPLSFGPQVQWPTGRFRPYVNAGLAAQFFYTQSGIEGTSDDNEFASTTNQSDWTGSWVAGGGVYIPLYSKTTSVSIDLGVQYYNGGRAQYLKPGSIEGLPNAQIRITPLESETHMMLVRLGVKIGL